MGKNPDSTDGDNDTERVTEETLRQDKYGKPGVDTSKDEDETDDTNESDEEDLEDNSGEDDGKTVDDAPAEETEDDSNEESDDDDSDTFVKEFDNIKGDTLSDYTRNLEQAYQLSGKEAMRLKTENDELKAKATTVTPPAEDDAASDDNKPPVITDPTQLFMKQKMDEEIVTAYTDFAKDFNQVDEPAEYNKFTKTVAQLTNTILASEGRMPSPRELYSKAAVILDWKPIETEPTPKEKAGMALRDRAAVSKGQTGPKKPVPKSKISQSMIELNRRMYPGKTDAEIRTELEPYVQ